MSNSEFVCDVVRVVELAKHPNADRLEIATVAGEGGRVLDYTIVVAKGEWKPGALAVHVGPDTMVPLAHPEFAFLKSRLDVKPGSSHYRLRQAKVRGVVSHGVLVKADLSERIGDDASVRLGVLKYETPAERQLRRLELSSVDNSGSSTGHFGRFVRFLGLNRDVRATVKREIPDYSLTPLRKAPGYFVPGEEVEVTEKIHGSNIRFGLWRGKPYVGSHHAIKTDMRSWWQRLLGWKSGVSKGHYYGKDIWSEWCAKNVDFNDLPDNVIFYGEIFGKGVQEFDYNSDKPDVRIFDVWIVEEQRWANEREKWWQCFKYGFAQVPRLYRGPYSEDLKSHMDGKSTMADHIREGCVIKSVDGHKRGKYVSDAYREAI